MRPYLFNLLSKFVFYQYSHSFLAKFPAEPARRLAGLLHGDNGAGRGRGSTQQPEFPLLKEVGHGLIKNFNKNCNQLPLGAAEWG